MFYIGRGGGHREGLGTVKRGAKRQNKSSGDGKTTKEWKGRATCQQESRINIMI